MKKFSVIFIILFLNFFLFVPPDLPAKTRTRGVYLYTLPNFLGSECHLTADISQLSQYRYKNKNFDDKISSIRIVGFSSVAVFTDPHFRGTCMTFTQDIRNLANTKIRVNTISSVKVNGQCVSNSRGVTLYDQKNFKGGSVTLTSDTPHLGDLNFNNKTASFVLHNLRSIAVFSKAHYQGKCQTFENNYQSLAGTEIGLNKIASIKLNDKCDEHKKLTVINRSPLIINVKFDSRHLMFPLSVGNYNLSPLASGQRKVFFIKAEANVEFFITAIVPQWRDITNPEIKLLCTQNIFMARDHTITVKGAVFKNMKCEKTVGN